MGSPWLGVKTKLEEGRKKIFPTMNEAADQNIADRQAKQLQQYQTEEQAKRLYDAQALQAAPNVGSQLSEAQAQARFAEYLKQQEMRNQAEAAQSVQQEIQRQQELGRQGWKKYPVQGR